MMSKPKRLPSAMAWRMATWPKASVGALGMQLSLAPTYVGTQDSRRQGRSRSSRFSHEGTTTRPATKARKHEEDGFLSRLHATKARKHEEDGLSLRVFVPRSYEKRLAFFAP